MTGEDKAITGEKKSEPQKGGEQQKEEIPLCVSCYHPLTNAVRPGVPGVDQVCMNSVCYRWGLPTLTSTKKSEVLDKLLPIEDPLKEAK